VFTLDAHQYFALYGARRRWDELRPTWAAGAFNSGDYYYIIDHGLLSLCGSWCAVG